MRPLSLAGLVVLSLAGCSSEPPAPAEGNLWPHRDQIATLFQLRTGELAGAFRKPVRACRGYWESGDAARATIPPASCNQTAERLAGLLAAEFSMELNETDVRDAALWRYVADRAKL